MSYILVGITNDWAEARREIMRSTDMAVLENMKATLAPWGVYKDLKIEKARRKVKW